ncbi:hypothetical protein DENSPDRAFT_855287 [Dentipellis sp. KUC8613]|nr:hypothetical protein DENSPDRAFT_855287 [Dentipellis sp. KUC8613]
MKIIFEEVFQWIEQELFWQPLNLDQLQDKLPWEYELLSMDAQFLPGNALSPVHPFLGFVVNLNLSPFLYRFHTACQVSDSEAKKGKQKKGAGSKRTAAAKDTDDEEDEEEEVKVDGSQKPKPQMKGKKKARTQAEEKELELEILIHL